jgi:hypothetical protein
VVKQKENSVECFQMNFLSIIFLNHLIAFGTKNKMDLNNYIILKIYLY